MIPSEGRRRVIISGVSPEIDCGRFPVKRTVGEPVVVEADIFADGHEVLACRLLYRRAGAENWVEELMTFLGNDRWQGSFRVEEMGRYVYTLRAWIDRFLSWRKDLAKRMEAGQQVTMDLLMGGQILDETLQRASEPDLKKLSSWVKTFQASGKERERIQLALSDEFAAVMARYPEDRLATTYEKELSVVVDPVKARFSTWYEMFPRSCSSRPGEHGSFRDCEASLPYVAAMGFDILYFPPIHPIGRVHRKGKNNLPYAEGRGSGEPLGHRGRRRRPQGGSSKIGNAAGFSTSLRQGERIRDRDRPGHRLSMRSGPPLYEGAPGMVPLAAGRDGAVRGEPSQEV